VCIKFDSRSFQPPNIEGPAAQDQNNNETKFFQAFVYGISIVGLWNSNIVNLCIQHELINYNLLVGHDISLVGPLTDCSHKTGILKLGGSQITKIFVQPRKNLKKSTNQNKI
jgi:hypothetical protein